MLVCLQSWIVRAGRASALLAGAALAFALSVSHAQGWKPERQVEIVLPSAAGSSLDSAARMIGRILVENKIVAWKPAKPGEQPGGWEWVYTLEPQGSEATKVTLTYDWSEVTDAKLKARFPMIEKHALEESLGNLASAVSEK